MPPGHFRLLTEQERDEDGNGVAEEEESGEDEEETGEGNEGDESFKRLKTLLDDLLVAGRAALAAPAPSSFLSPPHGPPSPSTASGSGSNLGLGVDTFVTGTRMDQGEVLGWDVGSGLGAEASLNVGAETGARRWKHGVAIGSKVLSPEEAKLWVGEEGDNEAEGRRRVEADTTEGRRESDREESPAAHEDAADSYGDTEPDIDADALT
ncbi:hypothetical protein JB92DRAFT_2942573 [Gautieria morchelliformis]|nr:hypothetical protein JB92DRAFT_2942573 [Gautieria morchelliformis]